MAGGCRMFMMVLRVSELEIMMGITREGEGANLYKKLYARRVNNGTNQITRSRQRRSAEWQHGSML